MANIKLYELPAGVDLLVDSNSFLDDLSESEMTAAFGGLTVNNNSEIGVQVNQEFNSEATVNFDISDFAV
jgi:hypothetical protein